MTENTANYNVNVQSDETTGEIKGVNVVFYNAGTIIDEVSITNAEDINELQESMENVHLTVQEMRLIIDQITADDQTIFYLTSTAETPGVPVWDNVNNTLPDGWSRTCPQVSENYRYVYSSTRVREDDVWGAFCTPTIYMEFNANSYDAIMYERIYRKTTGVDIVPPRPTNSSETPENTVPNENWSLNPLDPDPVNIVVWLCERKRQNGVWGEYSNPIKAFTYSKPGLDGTTFYPHIAYANTGSGEGISEEYFEGAEWMGTAYTTSSVWPDAAGAYSWARITGGIGPQGLPGTSQFLYFKFANVNPETNPGTPLYNDVKDWIGVCASSSTSAPSNYSAYTWQQWKGAQGAQGQQGIPGPTGANGQSSYLHIKYAPVSNPTNSQISEDDSLEYIGTYVDYNRDDSSYASSYSWSRWKGSEGKGTEHVFKLVGVNQSAPGAPSSSNSDGYVPSGWSNNPPGMSSTSPYVYVSKRVKTNGAWGAFGTPSVWSYLARDGTNMYASDITDYNAFIESMNSSTGRINAYSIQGFLPDNFMKTNPSKRSIVYNGVEGHVAFRFYRNGNMVFYDIGQPSTGLWHFYFSNEWTDAPGVFIPSDLIPKNTPYYIANELTPSVRIRIRGDGRVQQYAGALAGEHDFKGAGWWPLADETSALTRSGSGSVYVGSPVTVYFNKGGSVPINWNINGQAYGRTTSNGYASIPLNLNPGTYTVYARFPGNGSYDESEVSFSVTVMKATSCSIQAPSSVARGSYAEFTLTNNNGDVMAGRSIRISVNGRDYDRVTDNNGKVKLDINLTPGSYVFTLSSLESGMYNLSVSKTINVTG